MPPRLPRHCEGRLRPAAVRLPQSPSPVIARKAGRRCRWQKEAARFFRSRAVGGPSRSRPGNGNCGKACRPPLTFSVGAAISRPPIPDTRPGPRAGTSPTPTPPYRRSAPLPPKGEAPSLPLWGPWVCPVRTLGGRGTASAVEGYSLQTGGSYPPLRHRVVSTRRGGYQPPANNVAGRTPGRGQAPPLRCLPLRGPWVCPVRALGGRGPLHSPPPPIGAPRHFPPWGKLLPSPQGWILSVPMAIPNSAFRIPNFAFRISHSESRFFVSFFLTILRLKFTLYS